MGFGIKKEAGSNTTPSEIVNFDKLTPTTAGVVFDPNTPATEDILYVSSVDASTWIWNGTAYVTYTAPATATTEWYLLGTTIDAGSNKTASITRSGAIVLDSDSYFRGVRIGRGNSNIATNTVVGNGAGTTNTTGANNTFIGNGSGTTNNTGTNNTFIGSLSGNKTTTGSYNVSFGESALYNNTTGGSNTALGNQSLLGNISGIYTVSLGRNAGRFIADGATANTITNYSVFLGNETKALADNQSNQIVIGYNAIGKGSNTVQLGNTSITATYLQGEVNINPVSGQISRAIINSDNNVGALLSFRTANLPRWAIRKDGNETGSNVGGDLSVRRYDDAGAFIDNPISIKRSTGAVTLNSAYALPTTAPTSGQVLGYLGAGTTQWTTAGLSYFTEAQATASPNNLVYANSLTAVATTTNADFVILPKGNGAILGCIPNSSVTSPTIGGNKRGQYAIDLQRLGNINSPTAIASGNYAIILGGTANTASGTEALITNGDRNTASGLYASVINGYFHGASGNYSLVGNGQQNTASGLYGTAINGFGNIASSSYTFAGGNSCTASGGASFSYGGSNTASGSSSVALNNTNTASSDYSNARGLSANTGTTWGKWAIGGGGATLGSSQKGLLVQTTRTTGTTPTEIAFQGGGVDLRAQMTCADNMGMRVKGSVIGKQSGSTNISAWDFDYVIVRGVGVGTTAIVGTPTISVVTNIPAWGNPTITADTGRGYASLKVIGAAATNIHWTATIESTEVIYA
jgi:hypothetical protein